MQRHLKEIKDRIDEVFEPPKAHSEFERMRGSATAPRFVSSNMDLSSETADQMRARSDLRRDTGETPGVCGLPPEGGVGTDDSEQCAKTSAEAETKTEDESEPAEEETRSPARRSLSRDRKEAYGLEAEVQEPEAKGTLLQRSPNSRKLPSA